MKALAAKQQKGFLVKNQKTLTYSFTKIVHSIYLGNYTIWRKSTEKLTNKNQSACNCL